MNEIKILFFEPTDVLQLRMKINISVGSRVDFVACVPRSNCRGDSFVCPKHNESLSTHKEPTLL